MTFWVAASAGMSLLVSLILFALSIPAMLIGQHERDYWMREPILIGVLLSCVIIVPAFLAFITWLDQRCNRD